MVLIKHKNNNMTLSPLISTFGPFHIIHAVGGHIKYIEGMRPGDTKKKPTSQSCRYSLNVYVYSVQDTDPVCYLHD